MSDGWIVVRNWDKFQHYTDRRPLWIKLYTDINSDDEWLSLSTAARGMLTTIWAEYARSGGHLRVEKCMQLCGKSARSAHLEALNHAGFISIVASKPLAQRREEKEKRREPVATAQKSRPVDNSEGRTNVVPKDPAAAIRKMVRNGVITDPVDLAAEIAGYHLDEKTAERLRGLLH